MTNPDPVTVAARRVLLDALVAAAPFRTSLVVVGAQAVYLRTTTARLIGTYTTDGDLAIDPRGLPKEPALEDRLHGAGFIRMNQPGGWAKTLSVGGRSIEVSVDFLVPEGVAPGAGRRGVDLAGHDRLSARRVYGLEAALVDHGPITIQALDATDDRSVTVEVAGPAALLIAKLHKISERVASGRAQRTPVDKDAGDVYRLIQSTPLDEIRHGFHLALSSHLAAGVAHEAVEHMGQLFGRTTGIGVAMASRAVGIIGEGPETIAAVLTEYTRALLSDIT